MRMLTRARATGTSWLMASATGGASTAVTEIAGFVHNLDAIDPVPSCSRPSTGPAT